MKRRVQGTIGFMAVTICLVLVTAFCVVQTVKSQCAADVGELEGYYQVKEKEMVRQTRAFLQEAGYKNSGVALTRVVDGEGKRQYTMTIHHGKIDKMYEKARESLKNELSAFAFSAENCSFSHTFLIND